MKRIKIVLSVLIIVALSLVLCGCASGGSSSGPSAVKQLTQPIAKEKEVKKAFANDRAGLVKRYKEAKSKAHSDPREGGTTLDMIQWINDYYDKIEPIIKDFDQLIISSMSEEKVATYKEHKSSYESNREKAIADAHNEVAGGSAGSVVGGLIGIEKDEKWIDWMIEFTK